MSHKEGERENSISHEKATQLQRIPNIRSKVIRLKEGKASPKLQD